MLWAVKVKQSVCVCVRVWGGVLLATVAAILLFDVAASAASYRSPCMHYGTKLKTTTVNN